MVKKGQFRIILKVINCIKKYKYYVCISLISAIVNVIFTLYIPILTGNAIDLIIGKGNVNIQVIKKILIQILIYMCIAAIAAWIMNIVNNKIVYNTIQDIRRKAFKKIQNIPIKSIDGIAYGDMVSRVVADVDQFADGLLMGFSQLFTGIITILGTLYFMVTIDIKISLVVVLLTPISFLVAGFISKRTYNMFQIQSETRGEQTALIDEMIGNEKLVQAYHYEKRAMDRFDNVNTRLGKCSLTAIFFSSLTNPCTRFVNSLVYTGVGLTGAFGAINGGITVGQLTCFLSYANQYTKPFNEISGVITELQGALACAKRIFELLEMPEQVVNKEAIDIINPKGNIEFKGVNFGYDPENKLIKNLNLKVLEGQNVAIVGPTGCGKTTLINLLMRFYDVDSGVIKIDDYNIEDITRESLRISYGMVLQDTWFRTGTIKENILMARPDATDEEVIEAAKRSHAHSFIKRLPKGYDTVISEEAGGLSIGQRQLYQLQEL